MMQIVNPRFERIQHLKNLKLTIQCYDELVSIQLNKKDGYMVYHLNLKKYDEGCLNELRAFVKNYDAEISGDTFSSSEKTYFKLLNNSNWDYPTK